MISFLKGILIQKDLEETQPRVVLDVNGIGYLVLVPLSTYEKLPAENSPVKLYTYFHVREDTQQLYGFLTVTERELFNYLLKVPDIGPRTAISVMSHIEPLSFKTAVLSRDIRKLVSLPGIGKKTAEKIVLELKERIKDWIIEGEKEFGISARQEIRDAIAGLVGLGYREPQARMTIDEIVQSLSAGENFRAEDLITIALKRLSAKIS